MRVDNLESLTRYPLNQLEILDRRSTQEWQLIVLENEFTRVEILPDFGGMIRQITDLRNGFSVFSANLEIEGGGGRGAQIDGGIQWYVGDAPRDLSLAPIRYAIREPEDQDGAASVVMFERLPGLPISWHASISLNHDSNAIRIAFKLFNRGLMANAVSSGLAFPSEFEFDERWFSVANGMRLIVDSSRIVANESGSLLTLRPDCPQILPRETVGWEARLIIASEDSDVEFKHPELPISQSMFRATMNALWQSAYGDVVEGGEEDEDDLDDSDEDGEEQIPLHLFNEDDDAFLQIDDEGLDDEFDDLDSDEDDDDNELDGDNPFFEEFFDDPMELSAERQFIRAVVEFQLGASDGDELTIGDSIPGLRPMSLLCRAMMHARQQEFAQAIELVKDYLSYAADDPFTWWFLAALYRKSNIDSDVIENAHYLAPLDPLLRAEAFLSQSSAMTRDPNPLIKPLADDPDAMIDVACELMQVGFFDDLARWVDECRRHREIPQLRYMLAYAYRLQDTMMVEAAAEVSRASKAPLAPPFPSRVWEILAIRSMHEAFPNDARLAEIVALLDSAEEARQLYS